MAHSGDIHLVVIIILCNIRRLTVGWERFQKIASVLRRGDRVGEGDEVAAGVLDAEFLHAVESRADRHGDLHIFHCQEDGIEVVDFHSRDTWGLFGLPRTWMTARLFLRWRRFGTLLRRRLFEMPQNRGCCRQGLRWSLRSRGDRPRKE